MYCIKYAHGYNISMRKALLQELVKENIIKNGLVIALAVIFYIPMQNSLRGIDEVRLWDFLLVISILLVTVSFANFAFTYQRSKLSTLQSRMLSHSATFIFLLLTAFMIELMVIIVQFVHPPLFFLVATFSLLLYLGIALYDFWDLFRISVK
jgi:hypothetical protein